MTYYLRHSSRHGGRHILVPSFDFTSSLNGAAVTRTGTAYYFNSSKVLVSAATDNGRLAYDGETGEVNGLLLESASTNLLSWSRRLAAGSAEWSATNLTVADNVTGRDGGSNKASTLTATANNGTVLAAKTLSADDYTFSAWAHRKTGYGRVDVTLDGGTIWIEMTAHLLGGQWVKIGTHLLGVGRTLANPSAGFRLGESGDEIEVDLCQLEALPIATSAIPTEGATASRGAETLRAINIPSAGAGYGWNFSWPLAAGLRHARWVKQLVFSNVVAATSADVAVTYVCDQLGKPIYTQNLVGEALT